MLQNAGVLYILTCKCASRHSGVPFLAIGTSKSGPRVWCFTHFDLQMGFAPQRRAIFRHQNFKKCSDTVSFWAFCHSGVPFFRIATSKMAPRLWCFVHFDWQMCFAPQRRAIFGHRNFQTRSEIVVFCAFWLENVLRATAACHFSPVCWTGTSAPAALARPLFRASGTRNHWKNTAILGVANISRTCSLFLVALHACGSSFYWLYTRVDLLSADLTSLLCFSTLLTWHLYSAFQLCILSEVRLLNFLR